MNNMKKVGLIISIFMCTTLSLALPMIGVVQSFIKTGKINFPMYALSFILSFIISFMISMFLPTIRINMALEKKFGLKCNELKTRLLETFLSDLIYTPFLSFAMTSLSWYNIRESGGQAPPYVLMVLGSLAISFIVAYIIIFFALPVYLKMAMRMCDMKIPQNETKSGPKE